MQSQESARGGPHEAPRWKSSPNKLHELSPELETPHCRPQRLGVHGSGCLLVSYRSLARKRFSVALFCPGRAGVRRASIRAFILFIRQAISRVDTARGARGNRFSHLALS